MTWLDRFLVAFARFAVHLLHRRFSTEHQRVWWADVATFVPHRAIFPDGPPETWPSDVHAGMINIRFGEPGPGGATDAPRPLLQILMTRQMLDLFIDDAQEMRQRQDIQLNSRRKRRAAGPDN